MSKLDEIRASEESLKELEKDLDVNGTVDDFEDGINTEELIINFGPQHPSAHGVFRAILHIDL